MTIISTQQYIDWEIVESKMQAIADVDAVVIPCYYVGVIDGVEYAMQADGHHTLTAARELGKAVKFNVIDDPEGLSGEELLEARHSGEGDYYNVETSDLGSEQFDFIW